MSGSAEASSDTCSELTLEDFARSFGTTVDDIPAECRELVTRTDFRYRQLNGPERDRVLVDVLRKIESDKQVVGAPERRDVWQRGWEENLRDFVESAYDLDQLIPKFIRPGQPLRLNRSYVVPFNQNFELDYFRILRLWLFRKYLQEVDSVYEFGCGTGFNLVALAQLYPEKKLYGLDFVTSSLDLVNRIGKVHNWKITGHLFDMLTPDENLQIESDSAVLTIGSVEQLASDFEPFLQFLLKRSPELCIDILPTMELYDEANLIDYVAIMFHRKRGYTESYLTRLRELEAQNKIEILKVQRPFLGSLYLEGYSYVIWKPKKTRV